MRVCFRSSSPKHRFSLGSKVTPASKPATTRAPATTAKERRGNRRRTMRGRNRDQIVLVYEDKQYTSRQQFTPITPLKFLPTTSDRGIDAVIDSVLTNVLAAPIPPRDSRTKVA